MGGARLLLLGRDGAGPPVWTRLVRLGIPAVSTRPENLVPEEWRMVPLYDHVWAAVVATLY